MSIENLFTMTILEKISLLAKKEYTGLNLGVIRMRTVLDALDSPQDKYKVIHIAGTNGKGSTATITQSILVAAGFKTGLYTSPHFVDQRERIRINDHLIPKSRFEKIAAKVLAVIDAIKVELTYFEILTAIAFVYFAEEKIDILVAEVGLGGRLDATNVVKNKLACIITPIGYDHMEILGDTLEKITKEKAGIISRNCPVFANAGQKQTDRIVRKVCLKKKCLDFYYGRDFYGEFIKYDWKKGRQVFSYQGMYSKLDKLSMGLLGEHQVDNACLALGCIEYLFFDCRLKIKHAHFRSIVETGLRNAYWPGRFEIISKKIGGFSRTVILDGAHNDAGAKVFVKTMSSSPYVRQKPVIVMSVMRDKDYRAICKEFGKIASRVILFEANPDRSLDNKSLAKIWQRYLPTDAIITIAKLDELPKVLRKQDKIICVTGSLYGVAEAKKILK